MQKLALTAAREQNEVILKMIEGLKGECPDSSDEAQWGWNAALDAIAELIREANRE